MDVRMADLSVLLMAALMAGLSVYKVVVLKEHTTAAQTAVPWVPSMAVLMEI
jgi:SpoU rRNA methylase family enzyme